MKFHSPYQFINLKPVKTTITYENREKLKEINNKFVRHDYWNKEGLSGYIKCQLTTLSPLVVGAKQDAGTKAKEGTVHPYKQANGKIAIPANSLRGMIASLAENISSSSLRILNKEDDCSYSVRKRPTETVFKDLGLLHKHENDYYIYPLETTCKVSRYNGTKKKPNTNKLEDITGFKTYQNKDANKEQLIVYANTNTHNFLATQLKSKGEENDKGLLYIRGDHIGTKINETFIPWHKNNLDNLDKLNTKYLSDFYKVTDQVNELENILKLIHNKKNPEQQLPIGYERDFSQKDATIVQEGDLLYYRRDKETAPIKHLSYSQVWRKPVKGTLYKAIEREAGKDALPWNQNRNDLTAVEALFGIVEEDFDKAKNARSLASRLQFTDATAKESISTMDSVVLKILDSPKPPSPAMYFHGERDKNGKAKTIIKEKLDLDKHNLNGRKHYLPHTKQLHAHENRENWESKHQDKSNPPKNEKNVTNWSQYLRCTPINKQTEFTFKIHFENISKAELGLLLTTLQPTNGDGTFIHRLGLGKPYGLGQVNLKVNTVKTINRSQRYTIENLSKEREENYPWETKDINTEYIDTETLEELKTLYNPSNIKAVICYPFSSAENQTQGDEKEGYKWFGENENAQQEQLVPIKANQAIPLLDSSIK